ncbi:MAG: hypothetical protein LH473_11210 [Chitinophagales bacterium]|nr:hypothetical protein [Chitinophagales bacterium]
METKSTGISKFFRNVLILLIVTAVLDQLGGEILHYMYFKQKAGPNAETTFTFTKMHDDGFILGSSRGRRNYNPKIIADSLGISVYNAGHDGQTIFYEQAIVRMALARYTPKLVIIDLNPEEMYYRDLHYDRLNVLAPYFKDYPEVREIYLLKGIRDGKSEGNDFFVKPATIADNSWDNFWFRLHSMEQWVLPLNTERFKMASAIYPYNSSTLDILTGIFKNSKSESGFKPLKGTITEVKADELIRQNAALREEKGKRVDPNKIKGLEEILSTLTSKGIKVFVCMSPALAPFGMEPSYKAIEEVCSKYKVPFKDYSQDSSYLHLDLFFDNHMNKEGANMYSSNLGSDIKKGF